MILIDLAEAQTELTMNARRYSVESFAGGLGEVLWVDELIKVSNAIDLLRKLPEAVVRCKDCTHWHTSYCPMAYLEYELGRGNEPMDFCSLAERKEE